MSPPQPQFAPQTTLLSERSDSGANCAFWASYSRSYEPRRNFVISSEATAFTMVRIAALSSGSSFCHEAMTSRRLGSSLVSIRLNEARSGADSFGNSPPGAPPSVPGDTLHSDVVGAVVGCEFDSSRSSLFARSISIRPPEAAPGVFLRVIAPGFRRVEPLVSVEFRLLLCAGLALLAGLTRDRAAAPPPAHN